MERIKDKEDLVYNLQHAQLLKLSESNFKISSTLREKRKNIYLSTNANANANANANPNPNANV
jgi:hypothetical protein